MLLCSILEPGIPRNLSARPKVGIVSDCLQCGPGGRPGEGFMGDRITRRDFLNGLAVSALAPGAAARSEPSPVSAYPPSLTGLRGSHPGSFEMAHALRDGQRPDLAGVPVDEHYDLIVVGAGLSGLAAAHFYRHRQPRARILLLDTNDDFGGHAKRNEFDVDGRRLIGYGGTQSIDSPHRYSPVARSLLAELGVHLKRFEQAYDATLYPSLGLRRAVFFKREAFGVDRLVRQDFGPWDDVDEGWSAADLPRVRAYVDQVPISAASRARLWDMYASTRDVLAGTPAADRRRILGTTSARDFLRTYWQADEEILRVLGHRTHALWAAGIDAVAAEDTLALPGFQGLAERRAAPRPEPYIYHFPDGNASLARLLVRRLVPGAAPGSSMEDIVTARFDYAALDRPDSPVRLRLRSTAVAARNTPGGVEIAYAHGCALRRASAGRAILACYQAMVPYLVGDEMGEAQRAALRENVRAPLVYATLAARHWRPWHALGVAYISNPGGKYEASLDYPVSLGDYRCARDPSQPIVLHLEHTPCAPGLDLRAQYRAGRAWLYGASFEELEADIRDELGRMLGAGGFDFDRDIAAITINRWPHGYAFTPSPLTDPGDAPETRAALARRPLGRISLAGSDCGWNAYTNVAFDEAHRAVGEVLSHRA